MATIDSTLTAERVNKAGYVRDKVIPELEARGYKDGKDFHTKGSKRTSAPKLKLMLIDDIKKRSLQHVGRQGQSTWRWRLGLPPSCIQWRPNSGRAVNSRGDEARPPLHESNGDPAVVGL